MTRSACNLLSSRLGKFRRFRRWLYVRLLKPGSHLVGSNRTKRSAMSRLCDSWSFYVKRNKSKVTSIMTSSLLFVGYVLYAEKLLWRYNSFLGLCVSFTRNNLAAANRSRSESQITVLTVEKWQLAIIADKWRTAVVIDSLHYMLYFWDTDNETVYSIWNNLQRLQ